MDPAAAPAPPPTAAEAAEGLARALAGRRRVLALTGAGVSTASGIPDYRDDAGAWKRKPPVHLAEFRGSEAVRRRYWARSLVGWPRFAAAAPNEAHHALARLEAAGALAGLLTQNVDGLHQRAGSRRVLDLHGRLDAVACLACSATEARDAYQARLVAANPGAAADAPLAPDGDADLEPGALDAFRVPGCRRCDGLVKPTVVFFGEAVPAAVVAAAYAEVAAADALLVVGTSLQVFSGHRFVRAAAERGVPVVILNRGATRGDPLATWRVAADCGPALAAYAGLRAR